MKYQDKFRFAITIFLVLFSGADLSAQFCNTPIGFGRLATGGAGGTVYTVTNRNDSGAGSLRAALESSNRYIIKFAVTGTITLNSDVNVKSNKTVDGDGVYIRIRPYGFKINNQENIIIRNLHFDSDGNTHSGASGDAIVIQNGSRKIWIDHCTFEDYYDGLIDIIRESDNVTVSWCYFRGHRKVMLIGHSDAHTVDAGKLNVTVHHNYYDGTVQRQPRIRFGRAHVFNNYLKNISEMGMCSGTDAKMVIENNRFENVTKPAVLKYDSNWEGYITESGNQRINTVALHTRSPTFTPSSIYSYTLETADNTLRDFLIAYTGYNKTTNMTLTVSGNTLTANYLARSFQWYRNGTVISGATSNTYTAPNCGTYSVRLYGDQGCYKELTHTIAGQPAVPTITVVGGNAYFCTGGSVTLRSSAAPSGYSYQWSRNNTDISGATSRDYIVSQQGDYRVRLTGACPTANSSLVFIENRGALDCNGVCGGNAVLDCNSVCNGTATLDDCGICSGGNTGVVPNATKDCNGVCGGSATADCAGGCNGIVEDCNGICGGTATTDCAGVCGGTAVLDCNGDCGGTATIDDCGICSRGNTGIVPNANKDCAGDCFGNAVSDCNNDCNGNAILDDCGICLLPADPDFNVACIGCDGIINSGFETDACGQCLHIDDEFFNQCEITSARQTAIFNYQVDIFPNPYTEKLNICMKEGVVNNFLVEMFTLNGRKIMEKNMQKNCIELVNLPVAEGVYLLKISSNERIIFTGKVFREN